ncbi:MAG TPA: extracellular solute-binding protein [bacterium]|nr:extracellular solute-binding protein [bacterium]
MAWEKLRLVFFFAASMALGAARAEALTVYAAGPGEFDEAVCAAFRQATGEKVELWSSSTGKVMARLQAEQAQPRADVVILADQSAGIDLQNQGLVSPYRPSRILARLRPDLRAKSDFLPMGADTVVMVVNRQKLPGGRAPRDWDSLAETDFKDQATMPDPLLSGTASDFVLALLQQRPREGWGFFQALKKNGAIWPGPNEAALQPVVLGARSVLVAGVGHTVLQAKQQGNSLDLVFPASGTLLVPRPIIILKSSPNKEAAKKFVDFVLSGEGQALAAQSLLIPAVKSVAPDKAWPDLSRAKFWTVDWGRMSAERAKTLQRFKTEVIQ